jgi:hypothetical protein
MLVAGEKAHEGGGFVEGSRAEQETASCQLVEPTLGRFGQGRHPEGHGPKQDLLDECIRLVLGVPLAEMMGFAPGQSEDRRECFINAAFRMRG